MGIAVGVWCLGLLVLVAGSPLQRDFPEYSAELVRKINAMNTTWKAGPNFVGKTAESVLGRLRTEGSDVLVGATAQKKPVGAEAFPDEFDTRTQWPQCNTSIGHVFDEGRCHAGWAIAAVATMRDRYCIENNGQHFNFSAEDGLTCMNPYPTNGCNGTGVHWGSSEHVWLHWVGVGLVSGGDWNSTSGCKPYPYSPCDHYEEGTYGPCRNPPDKETTCIRACRPGYPTSYEADRLKGHYSSHVDPTEEAIQREVYFYGPVSAEIAIFKDFLMYRSGVYQQTGPGYIGIHGVKIIGWGVENGTKYWLCVNSWNDHWGDKGFVKIRRGTNEINIETYVYKGTISPTAKLREELP